MTLAAAWIIFILGLGHMVVGLVMFRAPLMAAVREGLVGKFTMNPERRTAFWFMIFGPLLIMGGHVAIHAVNVADAELLKIAGFYLFATGIAGTLALPRSPFVVALLVAPVFIAAGYGWIA
ncbi:MAG: hypothetical protein EPO06_10845 [Burkholderiaceae bacterium]|nr:MAG: hypothetical protein EPO06_10845 [Burkholderiaceae bacterium]